MTDRVDVLVRHVVALPDADLERLTIAARSGLAAVSTLRSSAGSTAVRAACAAIQSAAAGHSCLEVAGVIDGLRRARRRDGRRRIDLVWSGPPSEVTTHRLTSATVADLVDEAEHSVLLVSYAMHSEKTVGAALRRAVDRSVDITLLAERHVDNPSFSGSTAFTDLPAHRLTWPAAHREPGASLHAKILAIDERTVLVGSANLTQSAMERNLECGVVLRDRPTVRAVIDHVTSLKDRGMLVRISSVVCPPTERGEP